MELAMRHEEYSGNMEVLRGQGAKIKNKNKMQGSH